MSRKYSDTVGSCSNWSVIRSTIHRGISTCWRPLSVSRVFIDGRWGSLCVTNVFCAGWWGALCVGRVLVAGWKGVAVVAWDSGVERFVWAFPVVRFGWSSRLVWWSSLQFNSDGLVQDCGKQWSYHSLALSHCMWSSDHSLVLLKSLGFSFRQRLAETMDK